MEPTSPAARPRRSYGSRAQSGHFFMIDFAKRTLRHLYHAKYGKVVLVLFLIGVVATATASVSVFYYVSGTSSVHSPDIALVTGGDVSTSCSVYPCASGTNSTTKDVVTLTISFFPADTSASVIPATYYSDLARVQNVGSSSHSVQSIQVLNVVDSSSDLGSITVYYCPTQAQFSASGTLTGCVGSFAITSTTGGSVSGTFPQTIAAGAIQHIEVAAYAQSAATTGSVTFQIAVQWS